MSLTDLQQALQQQADDRQNMVTVTAAVIQDASLTARANFDSLIHSYLKLSRGLSVKVSGRIPAPTGNRLAFDGAVSFLGLSNATASLSFTQQGGTVDLRVSVPLGDGWEFRTSFAMAWGYPFDALTLNDAFYVFTTSPRDSFTWKRQSISLGQGLSFASSLGMGGPFGILESILESFSKDDTITFSGTIDPTHLYTLGSGLPNMSLTGAINSLVKALPSYFPLTDPRVALDISKDDDGNQYIWLSLVTTLNINDQPFGDFKAVILRGSSDLSFWFAPLKPVSPEKMIQLMGGEDFTKAIPEELRTSFDAFGLNSLAVGLNLKTFQVSLISVGIGATSPWKMGRFTMEELTLRYTILNPFGTKTSLFNFAAKSKFFPEVFKGEFVVEMIYDLSSKALSVAANYIGSVSLSDLVKGLSGGSVDITDIGFDITFDDFGVSFNKGGNGEYDYSLYGSAKASFPLPILGGNLTASFSASVDSATRSYKLIGGFQIGGSYFQAEADLGQSQKLLTASWNALGGQYLGASDIITELGFSAPDIPSDLDLGLKSASMTYDFANTILVLTAESVNYGKAVFVGRKTPTQQVQNGQGANHKGKWQFAFALDIHADINLSNLPLVGKEFPPGQTISVDDLQIMVASKPFDRDAVTSLNGLLAQLPADGLEQGLSLSTSMHFGDSNETLSLPVGGQSQAAGNGAAPPSTDTTPDATTPAPDSVAPAATVPAPSSTSAKWFKVQKSFGPVSFEKVGVQCQDGALRFLLDAALSTAGLTLSLDGLSVGSPLNKFDPTFNLQGLGIDYRRGPVEIGGAFLRTQATTPEALTPN